MSIVASRFIQLSNATARAQVYPERGFQLFGFQVKRGDSWIETIHAPLIPVEAADRRYGNPVLFPAVGVSNGAHPDSWQHEGKTYPMPPHGWARNVYWQVEQVSDESLTAALVPHPGFRLGFPFDFDMRMTYSLVGAQLQLDTVIRNLGEHAFPYALGFHPYLKAPLQAGEAQNCVVELPAGTRLRSDDGWRSFVSSPAPARRIALNDAELPGSIVLTNTGATALQVRHESSELATRVSVEGSEQDFPVWVAWTASAESPYVCLEPWTDAPNALNRQGTRQLASGQTHRYRMSLSLQNV